MRLFLFDASTPMSCSCAIKRHKGIKKLDKENTVQEGFVKVYGADVIVKINGTIEKISAKMVFYSRNPKTNRYCVNLHYGEDKTEGWYKFFVRKNMRGNPLKN